MLRLMWCSNDNFYSISLTHRETETVKTEQWEGCRGSGDCERERGGRETDAEANIDSIGEIRL